MLTVGTDGVRIQFPNGISLSVTFDGETLLGISEVTYEGNPMRCADECIMPEFATPDGLEADSFLYLGAFEKDGAVFIETRPLWRVAHRMEWQEHGGHYRISTKGWTRKHRDEETTLTWVIRPEAQRYGDVLYQGFSYSYRYASKDYKLYQIEDKATWEIGGDVRDNMLLMRNGFHQPIQSFDSEEAYESGWDMPGINNPHIFQHLPLYTELQGFFFQYNKEFILLSEYDHPSHVRSLLAKEKGGRALLHFNQLCFDLTLAYDTPFKKVMFTKNPFREAIALYNHYLRCREEISQRIWDYYDIVYDAPRPSAHVETWKIADPEQFDKVFAKLEEWHLKRYFLMPLWRSNETEVVPRFSKDRERFGDLGNMCCPLDFEIADCYGGKAGAAKILGSAKKRGQEPYMWFGSHFSALSTLGETIKDLWASDQSGQRSRNNYGGVLFAVNQNSKTYQDYLVNTFRELGEMGLRGVFRDSHFNMASDTINYRQTPYETQREGVTADQVDFVKAGEARLIEESVTSMHDAEIGIQHRFQKELGMLYYVESGGIIGTSYGGTRHEAVREAPWVYSGYDTALNTEALEKFGDDVLMTYFKGLSVRIFYQVCVEVNKFPHEGSVSSWWDEEKMPPMLLAYDEAEPYMKRMSLLGEGSTVRGIRWYGAEKEAWFIYEPMTVNGKEVYNVTDRHFEAADGEGNISLSALKIYLIK